MYQIVTIAVEGPNHQHSHHVTHRQIRYDDVSYCQNSWLLGGVHATAAPPPLHVIPLSSGEVPSS
jgi:hypothetical protein